MVYLIGIKLVAESLGKKNKGIFYDFKNTKNNHSVMQLYLDGKINFYTFVFFT